MKYLLFITSLFLFIPSQAQSADSLEAFGRAFFEHYKAQDYEWIRMRYASLYEIEKAIGFNSRKKEAFEKGAKHYDKRKQDYLETLRHNYNRLGMAQAQYVKTVNIYREGKGKKINIVLKNVLGRKFYLDVGVGIRSFHNNWTFHDNALNVYNNDVITLFRYAPRFMNYVGAQGADSLLPIINIDSLRAIKGKPLNAKPAAYPAGDLILANEVASELEYPNDAYVNRFEGIVWITFIIEKDGSITNLKLVRGIGGGCDEEAWRIVSKVYKNKWKPASINGRKVRSVCAAPVLFDIESSSRYRMELKEDKRKDELEHQRQMDH